MAQLVAAVTFFLPDKRVQDILIIDQYYKLPAPLNIIEPHPQNPPSPV